MERRALHAMPEGFRELRARGALGWVRPEAIAWWEESIAEYGTLYDAARHGPRPPGMDGVELRGRAPVFLLSLAFAELAVRHYNRGGAVATLLSDRYLRLGPLRPMIETWASEHLRDLGLPTPRVLAAAVYPSGPFYRCDLATEYIAGGVDVGELLFGSERGGGSDGKGDAARRVEVLDGVISLIDRLASAGVRHPDLNVKNFLIEVDVAPVKIHLLDLDRCRIDAGRRREAREGMVRRFSASLEKWEKASGRKLSREEWARVEAKPTS